MTDEPKKILIALFSILSTKTLLTAKKDIINISINKEIKDIYLELVENELDMRK